MDARLKAIRELRALSTGFANGELSFEKFRPALSWHSFDDEDEQGKWDPRVSVRDFPEELQGEYLFYVKWRVAAARGDPKAANWNYGDSQEPYGWIDKEAYRRAFSEEFARLKLLDIPND
jgi:hypothetical protein